MDVVVVLTLVLFGLVVFRSVDSAQTILTRKSHGLGESAATEARTGEFDWRGETAVASAVDFVVVESLDGQGRDGARRSGGTSSGVPGFGFPDD